MTTSSSPPPDMRPLLAGIAGPGKSQALDRAIRRSIGRIRSGRWVVIFVGDPKSLPPG